MLAACLGSTQLCLLGLLRWEAAEACGVASLGVSVCVNLPVVVWGQLGDCDCVAVLGTQQAAAGIPWPREGCRQALLNPTILVAAVAQPQGHSEALSPEER